MTKREKCVVSAYTGVLMCDFADLHQYIEQHEAESRTAEEFAPQFLGRPVWTHELAFSDVWKEIKEKTKPEFLELCRN